MMSQRIKRGCLIIFLLLIAIAAFPFLWRVAVRAYYGRHIYQVDNAPVERVAIVFGAEVLGGGRLSDVLRDRMDTAISLYEAGRVQKLLVSGDNQFVEYDEPSAMMAYAIEQGVPPEDVQPDYAGRRTYDTCYRARHIFQVESAILVTQDFHLPRAIFTCRQLGIESVGVSADLQPYLGARWYEVRETGATLAALWDVLRRQPAPVLGDPIPIE
jgi:SanA protein